METSAQKLKTAYLKEQLAAAAKAKETLRASYDAVLPALRSRRKINAELEERLEALTARFARLADILTQKVFRALDVVERTDEGSLLDRLNRMEKRRLISSAALWRDIRDLRNEIAHEYALKSLRPLQRAVVSHCPPLFQAVSKIEAYARLKKLL